jgi:heme oxygenase
LGDSQTVPYQVFSATRVEALERLELDAEPLDTHFAGVDGAHGDEWRPVAAPLRRLLTREDGRSARSDTGEPVLSSLSAILERGRFSQVPFQS